MSLFQRVARLAVLSLPLAAVLGSSTIGRAHEVELPIAPSPALVAPQIADPAVAAITDTITTAAPKVRFATLAAAATTTAVTAATAATTATAATPVPNGPPPLPGSGLPD